MLLDQIKRLLNKHNTVLTEELQEDLYQTLYASSPKTITHVDMTVFGASVYLDGEAPKSVYQMDEQKDPKKQSDVNTKRIGPYRDLGPLGVGGMGEIRKIYDERLNRTLAMKIVHKDLLKRSAVIARFVEEAQVGAQLQHPNIVPIHEIGQLDDGRLYFTMREIRGRTLKEVIDEVHDAIEDRQWKQTSSGWSFRRLIDAFHEVCVAMEYAHNKGVLHRDLKPENIMLGEYGEVLVVDWGIAKVLGQVDLLSQMSENDLVSTERSQTRQHATQIGQIAGTPSYMSPEQAMGQVDKLDGRSDIYALGTILYEILTGRPAYYGNTGIEILRKVIAGPPPSISVVPSTKNRLQSLQPIAQSEEQSDTLPRLPDVLVTACERAMKRKQKDRYAEVADFGQVVSDWLDGVKKQERALKIVDEAMKLVEKRSELEHEAMVLFQEAEIGLRDVPSWAQEAAKESWWKKEEKAEQLSQEAQTLLLLFKQQLQAALTVKSDLEEAHLALASHYREEHRLAERTRTLSKAKKAELRLQQHAEALPQGHPKQEEHFNYLKGVSGLNLEIDGEAVEIVLEKYEPYYKRLIPRVVTMISQEQLKGYSLGMGSYRLCLKGRSGHRIHYPFVVGRGEHWNGVDPFGVERSIQVGVIKETTQDCYVPAGWCWVGEEEHAGNPLNRRRIWVDSFIMKSKPVTNREYLYFLNDLVRKGRAGEALQYVPRERSGHSDHLGDMIYGQDCEGFFKLVPDGDGDLWKLGWPVMMINWYGAFGYSQWLAETTGKPWRLPHELEWEKAARGVDGRSYPWGDGFDPSYCCMMHSHEHNPLPVEVGTFSIDKSVYGVLGMGGNVMDWTNSSKVEDWSGLMVDEIPRSEVHTVETTTHKVFRGGCWNLNADESRCSSRSSRHPNRRFGVLGFRVCRSLTAEDLM